MSHNQSSQQPRLSVPLKRAKLKNSLWIRAHKFAQSKFAVLPLYEPAAHGCSCGDSNCDRAGKHPRTVHGVKDASLDPSVIQRWWERWPDANIGIATGAISDIVVVDLDGSAALATFLRISGLTALPRRATVHTGRGFHVYYCREGLRIGNSAGLLGAGIDVRGDGGYVVAPGSTHASGFMYQYIDRSFFPEDIVPERMPNYLAALAKTTPAVSTTPGVSETGYGDAALQREIANLLAAMPGNRNHTLNVCAFKLGQLCASGLLVEADVVGEMRDAALLIGLPTKEVDATIRSGMNAGCRNPRPLIPLADPPSASEKAIAPTPNANDPHSETLSKLPHTDAGNAERLVVRHRDKLLWTPGRHWLVYDGRIWSQDSKKSRIAMALDTAKQIVAEADFTNEQHCREHALRSQSKGALDRMVTVAESMLAQDDVILDSNQWRLAVGNGTLDLKTGTLLPHRPTDFITRILPTAFEPDATCPLFNSFLSGCLEDNEDLVRFLQKAVGMCLTGVAKEQVFFMLVGKGNTGKSTFLNLIRDMLGGYGMHSAMDTWLAKKAEQATQPDLARLKGARMVTAIEANFGQRLDEAKLKSVTGGEPIACRTLYKTPFEYVPQFKLWFAVNDLPGARSTSGSFWRRARVIAFDVEVEKANIDLDLDIKLRAELPGILVWAMRGCLLWQSEGLTPPKAVIDATAQWQEKVDHFVRFVHEDLIRDPTASTQSSFVLDQYQTWCTKNGEKAMEAKKVKLALVAEGFEHKRVNGRSYWYGLKLRIE